MGNNKSAAKAAAARMNQKPAPKVTVETEQVDDKRKDVKALKDMLNTTSRDSLSSDSKVILANLIDKAWVSKPDADPIFTDGSMMLRDALMADVIITNVARGTDTFALIIRNDESKYRAIAQMLALQGIQAPEYKTLPAPTKDQLRNANINLLPSETKIVTIKESDIDKEVIEQKKEEIAVLDKNPVEKAEDIKNEQQLREFLLAILATGQSITKRILRAIDLYRDYRKIKAGEDEKALAELEEKDGATLCKEIMNILGPCPVAINGAAKLLRKTVDATKSPISAFCHYRISDTNEVGILLHSDNTIAQIVRSIITWNCISSKNHCQKAIKECNRIIKKNPSTRTVEETAIRYNEQEIASANNALSMITNADMAIVDNLVDNYNGDEKSEEYKVAHRIVRNIVKAYYPEADDKASPSEALLKNCQQHAGIITNMFRDPLAQSIKYSAGNIIPLKKDEMEAKKEEKSGEKEEKSDEKEEPKNS